MGLYVVYMQRECQKCQKECDASGMQSSAKCEMVGWLQAT
jgi:hypothetical protein